MTQYASLLRQVISGVHLVTGPVTFRREVTLPMLTFRREVTFLTLLMLFV